MKNFIFTSILPDDGEQHTNAMWKLIWKWKTSERVG